LLIIVLVSVLQVHNLSVPSVPPKNLRNPKKKGLDKLRIRNNTYLHSMTPRGVAASKGRRRSQGGSNRFWQIGVAATGLRPVLPTAGSTGGRTLCAGAALLARDCGTGGRTLNTGAALLSLSTDAASVRTGLVLLKQK
jgi:hypothetical protein